MCIDTVACLCWDVGGEIRYRRKQFLRQFNQIRLSIHGLVAVAATEDATKGVRHEEVRFFDALVLVTGQD
jgi:hypothetical protein